MRMFAMLRAMDAFVGEQDDNTGDGGAAQDVVTCQCGAPVEPDALKKQTLPDGSPMWPAPMCRPMCWRCLVAALRRLDAELKRQPGKASE